MQKGKKTSVDGILAGLFFLLLVSGGMIFASAAFGLRARETIDITSVLFGHLVLGMGMGLAALVAMALFDYQKLRLYAPYFFGFSILATLLVFIPHIGMEHGGGKRWIIIAGHSFQPSELLKISAIIFAAAYFSVKGRVSTWNWGLGGLAAILALPVFILVLQPDIGTLGVVCAGVISVFFAAGAPWRSIVIVMLSALLFLGIIVTVKPYARDRLMTFLNPADGQQAESYQIKQSLIAIGSGQVAGRGFGQSIQKFTYLPEPIGDSIFAVVGEELGFVGASLIIVLYTLFVLRGYAVAARAPDMFGALLAVGIATYLVAEAFINIAAMVGLVPLTGIPLTFMSQGGSAMLISLMSVGILFNVSRYRIKPASNIRTMLPSMTRHGGSKPER